MFLSLPLFLSFVIVESRCSVCDFSFFLFFVLFCFLFYRLPSAAIEDTRKLLQSSALTVRSPPPLLLHIYCHGSLLYEPKTCFKAGLSCDADLRGVTPVIEVMLVNSVKPGHFCNSNVVNSPRNYGCTNEGSK